MENKRKLEINKYLIKEMDEGKSLEEIVGSLLESKETLNKIKEVIGNDN